MSLPDESYSGNASRALNQVSTVLLNTLCILPRSMVNLILANENAVVKILQVRFDFLVFDATFSNISAISWRPVLVVEEAGENHRPWASNW